MGLTMYQKNTAVPRSAGGGTQSVIRMVNVIRWGVSLSQRLISISYIFYSKGGYLGI